MLRALGLGDFLTAVPALRALRRCLPAAELILGTPPALDSLAQLAGVVDRVVAVEGLSADLSDVLPEAPDIAVNLHGRGPQSHAMLRSVNPGQLVAFANPDAGEPGPRWRPDEHEVVRWCRLVSESFAVACDPADLLLPPTRRASPAPGAVVIHPGAAYAARRWPPQRFAAVAAWASARRWPVVVTGGPGEREVAAEVAAGAGLDPVRVLAGRTDVVELAVLVEQARLVVCGDTGVGHLATAYGTPSVVLFGPVSPQLWGPPAEGPHVALWHGHGHGAGLGDPWGDRVDPALASIEVEEVVAAATSVLR